MPANKQPDQKPGRIGVYISKIPYASRFLTWRVSQKPWKRRALNLFFIVLVLFACHSILERSFRPVKNPVYGVSFSIKYSEELGLNWRDNYLSVIDELGVRKLRLMSYWDKGEPAKGQYNFSDLDWQMDQAALRGIKVSLSIGLRQPRWPECHQPAWAMELGEESAPWTEALNDYNLAVIDRYKTHPALESYQLENEALNKFFGKCRGTEVHGRLESEFRAAKQADPSHPIYMSLSDEHGFPANGPLPDAYGFSVYRRVWNDKMPIDFYVTYPTPIWYHRLRLWAIKTFKHRPVFIHELQLEPWGPKATRELSIAEQDKSMSIKQMRENFEFGRKIGSPDIYAWGSEWWYWRKVKLGDNGPWETAKSEFSR